MKHFINFYSEEGGAGADHLSSHEEMESITDDDKKLQEWMKKAEIGDWNDHKSGFMIRVKDRT